MKKTILKVTVSIITSLFFLSCSSDGAQGPAGPAGPAGTNGINGTNGTNGTNGINGNANVLGSEPFTTASNNWTSSVGGRAWTATLTGATSITQNIVDKGMVIVFRRYITNGVTQWAPLPDTNININISYSYSLGAIQFLAQSTNDTSIPNPGAVTFRYVVISPTNLSANPNVNWKNFSEVKKVLNLGN